MTPETILFFESDNQTENKNAQRRLRMVGSLKIQVVAEGRLLSGKVRLPFIETAGGDRFYGSHSIESFVTKKLKQGQENPGE